MTGAEFEAIPIMGEIRGEIRIVDGKAVRYATLTPSFALWNEDNEPLYWYYGMCKWRVGRYKGATYRQRVETYWVGENVNVPTPA